MNATGKHSYYWQPFVMHAGQPLKGSMDCLQLAHSRYSAPTEQHTSYTINYYHGPVGAVSLLLPWASRSSVTTITMGQ